MNHYQCLLGQKPYEKMPAPRARTRKKKNGQKMSPSPGLSYVRIVAELLPPRVTYDAAGASQLLCTIEKWFLQDVKRLI